MKKRFFLLIPFLFNIYLGVSHAQIIKKDRVAIFYIYCERYFNESTQKEEAMPQDLLVSQEELEKHLIGDPNTKDDDGYIPGNGSPISNFFAVNFNNHYQYRGKVFRVPLPLSEKEFNEAPQNSWFSQNIISALREKQKLAWPKTPNMEVDGFLQEDFDVVILLLGESSLFKAGAYSIAKYFDSYDQEHTININGTLLGIPSLSGKNTKPSSEDFGMYGGPYGPNGQFGPYKYYPEFDLWDRNDKSLLHEWGHHLGAFHSTSPCANADCSISSDNQFEYGTTCPDYFNFKCSENLVFNGGYMDYYCIMGGKEFSLLFNAKQRDECGLLPDAEKAVINSSKKNIKLIPLHKTGPGIRAGLIQIDKELSSPLIAREATVKINGNPVSIQKPFPNATAKIDLYVEYRRAESYDKNLSNTLLVDNTNGLMIHLAFNNVKIPPSTINWPDGSKLDVTQSWIDIFEPWFNTYSWLLDMSPHNGFTSVTLNQGWQFYHDDWEVTIRNIRPDGDNGITFDVDYGKRTDVVTGVHRCPTAGTACDDGQASTKDDKEDGNCNCAGTPCPAAGTACDDGQANTKDDKEDGNCNCAGTPCPAAGTACDDGQASTKDDKEDGNCNCAGTPCPAAGAACDDGNPNTKNDVEDGNCNCAGTPCPVAGAACDDGNPDTVSDKEDGNCNCAGIPKVNLGGGQGAQAILQKISPEMMAKIQAQGMPIHGGNTPPNVEGTYLFSKFVLKNSTNPQGGGPDQVGHVFADYNLTLSDQTTYNIKMSYVNGPEHGEGIGSFIVGEGDKFTVVAELDIKLNEAPAKIVLIISGSLAVNGINNAHYANFMLDNYGNTAVFMKNEEGRIIIDEDGLAEKNQN